MENFNRKIEFIKKNEMEIIEHKNITVDVKNEIEMYKNLSSQQKNDLLTIIYQ